MQYYFELAKEKNCHVLDVTKTVHASEIDGLYFDDIGHKQLANLVSEKIRKIL